MLKVNGTGRVVVKPELKELKDNQLSEFSVACNLGANDKVSFVSLVVFNKQAENMVKYLDKGSLISFNGTLEIESFERTDGSKGKNIKIINPEIEFLSVKKGGEMND